MFIAMFASLLALSPLPAVAQSEVGVHDSKPAPVPQSERPKVDEHGVTVYIENGGDFRIERAAVKSVHDGKIILERGRLNDAVLRAIKHAHDREEPGL